MDDHIDDFVVEDDDEEFDHSREIRNLFGYDKRKFRDEDDDCADMEADYRTIQREEAKRYSLGEVVTIVTRR